MVERARKFCRRHWAASTVAVITMMASLTGLAVNLLTLKNQLAFGDRAPIELMGWAGPEEAKKAWSEVKGKYKPFNISGAAQPSAGKVVKLWDAAKSVNNGEHLPTFRQLIGDCVGAGHKQALDYLQCVKAAIGEAEYKPIFSPYHYACGRVIIGRGQIRGPDGSVGAWQVEALKEYGAINCDEEGLPAYNESVIRAWAVKKPATKYLDIGKTHLLGEAAQVTTYAEARDAIANGYPVTVCSNRGFQMRPRVEGGKHWGIPSGEWNHCMCFIAVDDTVTCPSFAGGGKGALYLLNSWGPDAHGQPADDAPPGGFWISSKIAESMLKQEDSFALSGFAGFPAQDLQWVIPIGQLRKKIKQAYAVAL